MLTFKDFKDATDRLVKQKEVLIREIMVRLIVSIPINFKDNVVDLLEAIWEGEEYFEKQDVERLERLYYTGLAVFMKENEAEDIQELFLNVLEAQDWFCENPLDLLLKLMELDVSWDKLVWVIDRYKDTDDFKRGLMFPPSFCKSEIHINRIEHYISSNNVITFV